MSWMLRPICAGSICASTRPLLRAQNTYRSPWWNPSAPLLKSAIALGSLARIAATARSSIARAAAAVSSGAAAIAPAASSSAKAAGRSRAASLMVRPPGGFAVRLRPLEDPPGEQIQRVVGARVASVAVVVGRPAVELRIQHVLDAKAHVPERRAPAVCLAERHPVRLQDDRLRVRLAVGAAGERRRRIQQRVGLAPCLLPADRGAVGLLEEIRQRAAELVEIIVRLARSARVGEADQVLALPRLDHIGR